MDNESSFYISCIINHFTHIIQYYLAHYNHDNYIETISVNATKINCMYGKHYDYHEACIVDLWKLTSSSCKPTNMESKITLKGSVLTPQVTVKYAPTKTGSFLTQVI